MATLTEAVQKILETNYPVTHKHMSIDGVDTNGDIALTYESPNANAWKYFKIRLVLQRLNRDESGIWMVYPLMEFDTEGIVLLNQAIVTLTSIMQLFYREGFQERLMQVLQAIELENKREGQEEEGNL